MNDQIDLMEHQKRIAELRRRVLAKEPCTSDEIREVLDSIRRDRRAAAPGEKPVRARREKVGNVPVDTKALLNDLMGTK